MPSVIRTQTTALLLAWCFSLIGMGAAMAADWKMASGYPDNSYLTVTIREFLTNLEKQTKGNVKVTLHNNQSLVKLPDIARAVQSDQVALGEVYAAALGNQDPMFTLDAIRFSRRTRRRRGRFGKRRSRTSRCGSPRAGRVSCLRSSSRPGFYTSEAGDHRHRSRQGQAAHLQQRD